VYVNSDGKMLHLVFMLETGLIDTDKLI